MPDGIPKFRKFSKAGDTTVQNRNCIVLDEFYVKIQNNQLINNLVETHILCNENKVMDYYNPEDSTFYTLYDFNLSVGDTSKSYCPISNIYTYTLIDSLKEEVVNGQAVQVQFHSMIYQPGWQCELSSRVIENIGSSKYLFPRFGAVDPPQGGYLMCYSASNNFIYPEGNQGCEITVSEKHIEFEAGSIYPNPVTHVLNLDLLSFDYCTLFDSSGRQVLSSTEKTINMENLRTGLYYLKIVDKNKSGVVKLVKADR
ncbi:MAG: T9SS type A sorting domain-containing protein [Saprospiraceae bacterium]